MVWTRFILGFAILSSIAIEALFASPVSCALVGDRSDPLIATIIDLVDTKLADDSNVEMLDRGSVEKVLDEQRLNLALGGTDREEMIRLGAILRAKMLVMLTVRNHADGKTIDVAVSETTHGVRLESYAIVGDEKPGVIAETLAARLVFLAPRVEQNFALVAACPPFKSDDLTYEFDTLREAYAELARRSVARLPGVALADLNEAGQLAREIALSQGPATPRRPLPYYLMGRSSHDGSIEDPLVTLELKLMYDADELAMVTRSNVPRPEVARFIDESVRQLFKEVKDSSRSANSFEDSVEREADLLAERARVAELAGDWRDALELAEACLLLAPDRTAMHYTAFRACTQLLQYGRWLGDPVAEKPAIRGRRQLVLQGLNHLASYVRKRPLQLPQWIDYSNFWTVSWPEMGYDWASDPQRLLPLENSIASHKRSIIRALLAYPETFTAPHFLVGSVGMTSNFPNIIPFADHFSLVADVACALDRSDNAYTYQCRILMDARRPLLIRASDERRIAYDALLNDLKSHTDDPVSISAGIIADLHHAATPETRQAALNRANHTLSKLLGSPQAKVIISHLKTHFQLNESLPNDQEHHRVADLQFDSISFQLQAVGEKAPIQFHRGTKWIANDDQWELISHNQSIYRMVESYVLRPLPLPHAPDQFHVYEADSDGTYLWLSGLLQGADHLCVVDLRTMSMVAEFTRADGVPSIITAMTAYGPGKICAAGGVGRSWIGLASIDVDGEQIAKSFEIIHEARIVADPSSPGDHPLNAAFAFTPVELISLPSESPVAQWAILRRKVGIPNDYAEPLIINLEAREVRVAPLRWLGHARAATFAKGVLLAPVWCEPRYNLNCFAWATPPDFAPAVTIVPEGCSSIHAPSDVVIMGEDIHVVNDRWMTIDMSRATIKRCAPLPAGLRFGRLVHSSHCGLIYFSAVKSQGEAWSVQLDDSEH